MASRITLKGFFKRGNKPTEGQFASLIDSFYKKDEDTLSIADVQNLPQTLAGKVSASEVSAAVISEAQARQSADASLQAQIDDILQSDLLPDQTGKSGKVLSTDGEQASWVTPTGSGAPGVGVPVGGLSGQVLAKNSGNDYDTRWINLPSSGGGSSARVYNVENYGAVHDGQTDDTAAIQAAINAADAAGGGVVYFPNGIYALNSPVVDSDSNAQLIVPVHNFVDSISHNHIKLLGEVAPNYYSQPFNNGGAPPNTGVILKSNVAGSINVLGSKSGGSPWGVFNYCHLEVENITIRLKSKDGSTNIAPAATAINAARLAYLSILNVRIDTETNQADIVKPLFTSVGVVTPLTNNFVLVNIDKCHVEGVYTAFEISEHASLDNIFIDGCYEGISFNTSFHPALINKICIARTAINIVVKGIMPFSINQLAIEDFYGGWISNIYDLDERVLGSIGYIRFTRVVSNVGLDNGQFVRSNGGISQITTEVLNSSSSRLVVPNPRVDDYTITNLDAFKLVTFNKPTDMALIIPTNSSVPLLVGTSIMVGQLGAGAINVTGSPGVTIISNGNKFTTNGKGAIANLFKVTNNSWLLSGDLVATGNGGGDADNGGSSDSDAQAFLSAAGIDNAAEIDAINNLVIALKNNAIWDKLRAIYPFVGGTDVTASYNLKDPTSYRLAFYGQKSFDSKGYNTNGSTSYANTSLNPSLAMPGKQDSFHFSYYNGLASNNGGSYMGCYDNGAPISQLELAYGGSVNYTSINSQRGGTTSYNPPPANTFKGFWLANRNNANEETIDKDGALFSSATYLSQTLPNAEFYIGCNNSSTSGSPRDYASSMCGFASIGEGFTNAEKLQFANAVSVFINALSR